MSSVMIQTGMPATRLAASFRNHRLTAMLVLGAVFLAIGFAYPSSSTSPAFVSLAVPQIVTINGP